MKSLIINWTRRYFSDPDAVILFLTLIFAGVILFTLGKLLMPLLASIVIAYLLQALVSQLEHWKCPHWLAVIIVFSAFVGFFIIALLGLLLNLLREWQKTLPKIPIIHQKIIRQ